MISLEANASHIIKLDDTGQDTTNVTVIYANHCRGVMYMFEGYFGTILHTGDFRYEPTIMNYVLSEKTIDVLHLDNTYCNPACDFPLQSTSRQNNIIDIIRRPPDHDVVLLLRTLNKEDLLVYIVLHFNTSIVISQCPTG